MKDKVININGSKTQIEIFAIVSDKKPPKNIFDTTWWTKLLNTVK